MNTETNVIMTPAQILTEMESIQKDAEERTLELMKKIREQHADGMGGSKPLAFQSTPEFLQIEKKADAIAELGGWIRDRLNGHSLSGRNSVCSKVRKALGYYS